MTKGFKPKLNIMDNQATKPVKQFLSKNEHKLQCVEPHNHRVNAMEWSIETFKDAALATIDVNFPLQLWDKFTLHVQNCLNLMHRSQTEPSKSDYKTMNGPYNWNRYPLGPLGCKAVVYKDRDTRGLWASWGINGWYLGPSMNHYPCDLYFIPKTQAYQIRDQRNYFCNIASCRT